MLVEEELYSEFPSCPECDAVILIPDEGCDALETNVELLRLAENLSDGSSTTHQVMDDFADHVDAYEDNVYGIPSEFGTSPTTESDTMHLFEDDLDDDVFTETVDSPPETCHFEETQEDNSNYYFREETSNARVQNDMQDPQEDEYVISRLGSYPQPIPAINVDPSPDICSEIAKVSFDIDSDSDTERSQHTYVVNVESVPSDEAKLKIRTDLESHANPHVSTEDNGIASVEGSGVNADGELDQSVITVPDLKEETDANSSGASRNATYNDENVDTHVVCQQQTTPENSTENIRSSSSSSATSTVLKTEPQSVKMCHRHSNTTRDGYCVSCEEVICAQCLVENHLDHDVKRLVDYVRSVRERASDTLTLGEKWRERLNKLKDLKSSFLISLDVEYEDIDKHASSYVECVRSEGNRLSSNLNDMSSQIDDLSTTVAVLKEEIRVLKCAHDSLSTMTSKVAKQNHSAMVKQVSQLHDNIQTQSGVDNNVSPVRFMGITPGPVSVSLGKLVVVPQLKLFKTIRDFGDAAFVAFGVNGNWIVGDLKCDNVKLYQYDNEASTYVNHVVARYRPSCGVGITTDNNYVVVGTTAGVVIVPSDGEQIPLVSPSATDTEKSIMFIQVEHDRIFTASSSKSCVTEYDCNRLCKLRTIRLNNRVRRFKFLSRSRIAVIYVDGETVHIIDTRHGKRRTAPRCINLQPQMIPTCLSYDEKSDCLIIGSCRTPSGTDGSKFIPGTGVIEQYCSVTGQFVVRLLEGLNVVSDMALSPDGHILAVAEEISVRLYSMKLE